MNMYYVINLRETQRTSKLSTNSLNINVFFSLGFLSRTFTNRRTAGEGKGGGGISLTPHCHFHPIHRHLDISQPITGERSPLPDSNKLLTTKLRSRKIIVDDIVLVFYEKVSKHFWKIVIIT